MKIGLFGGSFNPIHRQHLAIAEAARDQAGLDQVWLLPVFRPVHKDDAALLSYAQRRSLVEAAVAGRTGLQVSDLERELGGPSFTIRLVRHCQQAFPGNTFHLIIGADSLKDLPEWHEARALVRSLPFLVVSRPGIPPELPLPNPDSRWLAVAPDPVSSWAIRAALRRGRCRRLPVPSVVMALIIEQDLFGCLGPAYRSWLATIRTRIDREAPRMREHLQGVARQTAEFAAALDLDPRQGYLAGLAHDLFRLAAPSVLARWGRNAPGHPSALERQLPMLAHGRAAAGFLRHLRPAVPAAVVEAVRQHTFPRLRMAPLTRALVLGDALEPGRGNPEWDAIRNGPEPLAEKFRLVVARKREKARRRSERPLAKVTGPVGAAWPVPHE